MTVNKELVKLWVDTLRSGKYQQGTRALRNKDDKFCCLGVLCDITKDTLNLEWELESIEGIYTIETNGGVLPDSVWKYLGKEVDYKVKISVTNSKLPLSVTESSLFSKHIYLVTLNDHYQLSFDQIADILEEEFLHENTTTNVA